MVVDFAAPVSAMLLVSVTQQRLAHSTSHANATQVEASKLHELAWLVFGHSCQLKVVHTVKDPAADEGDGSDDEEEIELGKAFRTKTVVKFHRFRKRVWTTPWRYIHTQQQQQPHAG